MNKNAHEISLKGENREGGRTIVSGSAGGRFCFDKGTAIFL